MKIYAAPLEGITGYVFRNAFHSCFDCVDKYFIPFINPNQHGHLSSRERQDILPENNQGMYAVPQILTNCAEDFSAYGEKTFPVWIHGDQFESGMSVQDRSDKRTRIRFFGISGRTGPVSG